MLKLFACSLGIIVFCLPAGAQNALAPAEPVPGQITNHERLSAFVRSTIGPGAIAKSAFTAGIRQWRDKPEEWGQGMAGYGRRFGSRFADRSAGNSIEYSLGALIGEDPRYFRSRTTGFLPRLGHAVGSTFTAPVAGGGVHPAYARFTGAYAGAALTTAWYPESYRDARHVLTRGSLYLAGDMVGNIFREFWPDVRRKLFRK